MQRCLLSAIAGVVCLMTAVLGYPQGAPVSQCQSMTPGHGTESTNANPYVITVNSVTKYSSGDTIIVTVSGMAFKGILMQMRKVGTSEVIGQWKKLASETKTINCTSHLDTITHANTIAKSASQFTWVAPGVSTDDVQVVATIAQEKTIWWKNVKSLQIMYNPATTPVQSTLRVVMMATLVLFVVRLLA